MKRIFCIWFLANCLLPATGVAQQAKAKDSWIRVSQQVIRSNSFIGPAPGSMKTAIRTNSYYSTIVSGEYRVNGRLVVGGSFPVFVRVTVNGVRYNQTGATEPGGALNSMGDAEVGVSYSWMRNKKLDVRSFLYTGLPTGKKGDISRPDNLQTGDGEFNQHVGLDVRYKVPRLALAGHVGFNNRSEHYSNEIRYGFDISFVRSYWHAKLKFYSIESLFNDVAPTSPNGLFSNHRELIQPGLEVMYTIGSAGFFGTLDMPVAGRNTLNAPLLSLGVNFQRPGRR